MRVRVITLKFDPVQEMFDDTHLLEFTGDKEILSVNEHFFVKNGKHYMALVITYLPSETGAAVSDRSTARPGKTEDWRRIISEEDLPLFDTMREWRTERAKKEGIPVYVICNNMELARIVKEKPQSLNALRNIRGMGKAKAEKYGKDILEKLHSESAKQAEAPPEPPEKAPREPAAGAAQDALPFGGKGGDDGKR